MLLLSGGDAAAAGEGAGIPRNWDVWGALHKGRKALGWVPETREGKLKEQGTPQRRKTHWIQLVICVEK